MSRLWRRLARDQRGYSLIEMLTVMTIMAAVFGAITTLFVAGSNAEADMNNRFQAQLSARLAVDKIRREGHCASVVALTGTPSGSLYPSVTETLPSGCGSSISWCTAAVAGWTQRYRLYRQTGSTCSAAGGTQFADYLTSGTVFSYTAQSTTALAKLTVDFPVNLNPATKPQESYELKDDIVLRNSSRS